MGWNVGGGERHCQKLGQTRESFPPARGTDSSRLLQPQTSVHVAGTFMRRGDGL